jgi:hypothetical protein
VRIYVNICTTLNIVLTSIDVGFTITGSFVLFFIFIIFYLAYISFVLVFHLD